MTYRVPKTVPRNRLGTAPGKPLRVRAAHGSPGKACAKARAKHMVDEAQQAGQLNKRGGDPKTKAQSHSLVTLAEVGLTKQEVADGIESITN